MYKEGSIHIRPLRSDYSNSILTELWEHRRFWLVNKHTHSDYVQVVYMLTVSLPISKCFNTQTLYKQSTLVSIYIDPSIAMHHKLPGCKEMVPQFNLIAIRQDYTIAI